MATSFPAIAASAKPPAPTLQQAIASGAYRIAAADLAGKLVTTLQS